MFKKRTRGNTNLRKKPTEEEPDSDDGHQNEAVVQGRIDTRRGKGIQVEGVKKKELNDFNKMGEEYAAELDKRMRDREAVENSTGKEARELSSAMQRTTVQDSKTHICKPFQMKGKCQYGDSCKYAHIIGDYDQSEVDKSWEQANKQLATLAAEEEEKKKQAEIDQITCRICSKQYIDPVITVNCKHVFCSTCATAHETKRKGCFICKKPTDGIFNSARQTIKLLQIKEAKEAREARRQQANHDSSSSEPEEPAAKKKKFVSTCDWSIPGSSW
eukprot:TRINITY_DN3691_c8_g1_i1.p1 TRINITY_DN3691_c8_g1~~TRINITY_DN3691_c8_g1_i1.p1  ORF type:complete len:283 (+),score=81.52 TRINITY_DN3691_c8_g1_i1:33-851(+)